MDVDRYLERIGISSRPVSPLPGAAYRKVVEQRRGGFCFELNGLIAALLASLGFRASFLAARPLRGEDWMAPPFAHMALLVELERRWLVDVAFGFPFAIEPLALDERAPQERAGREFAIGEEGGALLVEELGAPERRAYLLDEEPRQRDDFAERSRLSSTDPESMFVRLGPVLQQFEDGWVAVTRAEAAANAEAPASPADSATSRTGETPCLSTSACWSRAPRCAAAPDQASVPLLAGRLG